MAIRFLSTQYIDGSLGIGTANPQDQLHLASSLPSIRLEDTDDNYYHRIRGNGSNLIIVADAGNAANNSSIRFQVDADEKMRITSDGNVGINITPASSVALDVKEPDSSNDLILGLTAGTGSRAQIRSVVQTSTESALSFHTTLSSSTQERFRILNTGAFSLGNSGTNYGTAGQVLTSNGNSAPYWSTPTSGTITGSGTSGRLAKFTGTSSIGDSGIIDSSNAVAITINGNEEVGIGTSPFTKLDVYDSSTSVNIIRARNNTQQIALGVNDASGGAFLFVNTNHALRFGCNGSEVARFTADGTLKFPSAAKTKKIELWSTTTNDYQFYGFGVEGSTLVYSVYDVGDSHVFFAGSSSTSRTEIMRVSGNGNVSIGTTANTLARLNVYDTTAGQSTSRVVDISNSVDANINIWLSQSGAATKYAEIASFSTIPLVLNNVSGGNVGIGTTAPSEKLQVNGNIRVAGVGNSIGFDTTGALLSNGIKTINDYETLIYNGRGAAGFAVIGNTNIRLGFGTNYTNAETDLFINSSGNVGIGTTSPTRTLSVVKNTTITSGFNDISEFLDTTIGVGGSISLNIGRANSTKNLGKMAFKYAGSGSNSNAINWGFYDADNLMTLLASGNVGIGTTSPVSKLHVVGEARVYTGSSLGYWGVDAGNSYVYFGTNTSNYSLSFQTSGTERMRITSLGRVDIGTRSYVGSATTTTRLYLEGNTSGHNLGQFQMANFSAGFMFYLSSSSPNTNQSHQFYNNRIDSSPSIVGSIAINSTTTSFNTTSSDERSKKNIEDWNDSVLSKFESLQPKKFHFNFQEDTEDKDLGFIAQNEVGKFPEAYPLTDDDGDGEYRYKFNPSGMVVYLMKAIQELKAEIEELKKSK